MRRFMRMKDAHRPARRPTNLSLDPALVTEARALGLNVSRTVEDGLRKAVAEARSRRWLEENRAGFDAFASFVERHGVFNEDDREW
jgi:antitoxin CcdA